MEEYEEKFEELKTLMLVRNPKLDELYFVSSFISGLKEEIKPMVKMFKPQSLTKAFEVAELQECSLELQSRNSRSGGRTAMEPKFGMYRYSSNHQNQAGAYKVPPTAPNTKRKEVLSRETQKISAEEMQYRRQHHLCYRCGDKFGVGHQCKSANLNCLELEEDEGTDFEDAIGEQDENTGHVGELAEEEINRVNG